MAGKSGETPKVFPATIKRQDPKKLSLSVVVVVVVVVVGAVFQFQCLIFVTFVDPSPVWIKVLGYVVGMISASNVNRMFCLLLLVKAYQIGS